MVILRESTHLCGSLGGVEANYLIDKKSIGYAMGQMMERAKLVSHGVTYAKERVCERHTCHCSGICHLLARNIVGRTRVISGGSAVVSSGQVVEDHLKRLLSQTVGVVGSHNGSESLKVVSYRVDTRSGGQSLRTAHHHVRVNDSHLGHKLVVRERILDAGLLVGDYRERSYLGACTRGGGNCDEVCLVAHVRECVNSLAYIYEAHSHILEIRLGVLVKYPHDLSSVHCGTAAHCDNAVRLELSHELRAALCGSEGGIGLYIGEGGVCNAHLVKLIGDYLGETALEQERVGYNEHALLVQNVLKLLESNGQTALLYINLFGCAEPEHILSPLSKCLDIYKVLYANVLGNGVAAP